MKEIEQLKQWIKDSDNIVFFGGAGVSTESQIPDFRSVDGLYNQEYDYPPETILSHTFFMRNPQEFYRFYRNKMIFQEAEPNKAHVALAKLEQQGKLKAVITQNIDGLHQKAGSKEVLELHGSVLRNYCMECRRFFTLEELLAREEVPRCECGGIIKPDVVLYEEGLDSYLLERAVSYIQNADMLIIGGTSLAVYPAAGLIDYYRGQKLVLINKDQTSRDGQANLVLHEPIGQVFSQVVE
ncbi:MAG: NAD-dependent protein deacylase [Lachnospiraceae bacterium]|nr:NAD-dependent protein deacylase [Lachnospiraceae bacterium]